jgi:hypothetical protein
MGVIDKVLANMYKPKEKNVKKLEQYIQKLKEEGRIDERIKEL